MKAHEAQTEIGCVGNSLRTTKNIEEARGKARENKEEKKKRKEKEGWIVPPPKSFVKLLIKIDYFVARRNLRTLTTFFHERKILRRATHTTRLISDTVRRKLVNAISYLDTLI